MALPKLDTVFLWDGAPRPSTGNPTSSFPSSAASSNSAARDGVYGTPNSGVPAARDNFYRRAADADPFGGAILYPPSSHSTTLAAYENAFTMSVPQRPRKRIRSQYPPSSSEPHVEFILVAHFNIDTGAVMEFQYPGPISDSNEHMLAQLMLPDGVHARAQDWTTFFLHKDLSALETDSEGPSGRSSQRHSNADDAADDAFEDDPLEPPPLVYVLNHVNTKHDPTVKRGAVVKAMAICTRHSFLDIYKPLLVLAIEEYFKAPTFDTLAEIYSAVNAVDLSLIPRVSILEAHILRSSTIKDLFIEKFEQMIYQQREEDQKVLNNTSSSTNLARPLLPRDTHEFESRISYRGHSIPVKVPVAQSPETIGSFSIIKLITTFSNPHTSNPTHLIPLHPHLTTSGPLTHPIIVLVNALLTQKRIMFLGANLPSESVAEAVLASCSMVSGGVLRGFTRHAFPYTDLTKIDELLKIPGFIAGVTNPLFANREDWWDVLADLSTGRVRISSKIEQPPPSEGLALFASQNPGIANTLLSPLGAKDVAATVSSAAAQSILDKDYTGDVAFMSGVQRAIAQRLGENVVRSMWCEYIVRMTRITSSFEEIVYGASALYIGAPPSDNDHSTSASSAADLAGHGYVWPDEASRQKELAGNVSRIEGWRVTRSYYIFKQDLMSFWKILPIKDVDLHYHHDRLRILKLSHEESAKIYLGLEKIVKGNREVDQLLTVANERAGGLFYISLGLVHESELVRRKTVDLLERIRVHDAGKHFWERLGRFAKLAFWRIRREMESMVRGGGGGGGGGGGAVGARGGLEGANSGV